MCQPGILPSFECVQAFVDEFDLGVAVHVDGVGIIRIPDVMGRIRTHLHPLGGVHFNLLEEGVVRENQEDKEYVNDNITMGGMNSGKVSNCHQSDVDAG